MHGQAEFLRARQVCADTLSVLQSDILEQPPMWSLQSKEIVAAVGPWPEDDTIAGRGQGGGGSHEVRSGQRRAVGIEQTHGTVASVE